MRGRAREALLQAAQDALAEHGFAATTARTVAEASGANLRSIAYHYGSLHELLLAALSANFHAWMAPLIQTVTATTSDPRDRLQRGLALFAAELPHRSGLVAAWVEAVGLTRHDPDLRKRLAANQAGFAKALTHTLAAAGEPAPDRLARALMTACDGIMIRYLLHAETINPLTLAAELQPAAQLVSQAN
jgi:AcrR family transcriptional regulator